MHAIHATDSTLSLHWYKCLPFQGAIRTYVFAGPHRSTSSFFGLSFFPAIISLQSISTFINQLQYASLSLVRLHTWGSELMKTTVPQQPSIRSFENNLRLSGSKDQCCCTQDCWAAAAHSAASHTVARNWAPGVRGVSKVSEDIYKIFSDTAPVEDGSFKIS